MKKAEMAISTLIGIIIGVLALVILVAAIIYFKGEGSSAIQTVKNWLRFGK